MPIRKAKYLKPKHSEAARHICEEVRVVLSSLRGGPPDVAYGDLASNLRDLRNKVRTRFLDNTFVSNPAVSEQEFPLKENDLSSDISATVTLTTKSTTTNTIGINDEHSSIAAPEIDNSQSSLDRVTNIDANNNDGDVGPYANPFLSVIKDPRAAGPHTLVALRALHRLLERGSLVPVYPHVEVTQDYWCGTEHIVPLDTLMVGVLQCKFELTDAGADEAVEMAIADLLSLLVAIDANYDGGKVLNSNFRHGLIRPETFMDAFNTVFVTRNTFVHSPALCYHFEDVLKGMVGAAFCKKWRRANSTESNNEGSNTNNSKPQRSAAQLIFEFLVQQLLHTPFIISGTVNGGLEAQAAHDATRILCLRLSRCCLCTGWGDDEHYLNSEEEKDENNDLICEWDEGSVLRIVQDEFCLSLLLTGQAFWSDGISTTSGSTGILSIEVLSEICATISTLWSISSLRHHLEAQFEAIFTGFFQRALSLLRRRTAPMDNDEYLANVVFDSEIEIVLETLVDILHLHDKNVLKEGLGALETLFLTYDCNMNRSDVATGLIIELSRCCGGQVKMEEYNSLFSHSRSEMFESSDDVSATDSIKDELSQRRKVPPRLKELCGDALIGTMQCIFGESVQPDTPSMETVDDTTVGSPGSHSTSNNSLRRTKYKKRIMHKGAMLFNKKSKEGIKFLISEGILPAQTTPKDVAEFLRQGLVVGLDKVAVGSYLGEAGKAPVAGKSPHDCERDWFHKETLKEYCALFCFKNQSLLDGLRMFLSSFRLPGEAQQIDRILQAFAESCGKHCEEGSELGLFSDDPKKAADAAYLLAFSLIMLNTDLHNDNIKPERKMSKSDFVKNNSNYGRDITDEGKDLPREVLENLYDSIRDVELRTEGEGADGVMTIERWKDVLRGQGRSASHNTGMSLFSNNVSFHNHLKTILVETIWTPILSSIGGCWGVHDSPDFSSRSFDNEKEEENEYQPENNIVASQGSRLGIDLAINLFNGLRSMGRIDIFQSVFITICDFSGLSNASYGNIERTILFGNSFERQSALITAMSVAKDSGDDIGVNGWKALWSMVFELRDLKLLSRNRRNGLIFESDHDLLTPDNRKLWKKMLLQQGSGRRSSDTTNNSSSTSVMGTMSRIFFGDSERQSSSHSLIPDDDGLAFSRHEKEKLFLWDDLDDDGPDNEVLNMDHDPSISLGTMFENLIIQESDSMPQQESIYLDSPTSLSSQRKQIRNRLSNVCDFSSLISGSRYQSLDGIRDLLVSLVDLIRQNQSHLYGIRDKEDSDSFHHMQDDAIVVLSPASEALAEILICEIAIKNRDRIVPLWEKVLRTHYDERLKKIHQTDERIDEQTLKALTNPGIEKCVTGLLRICSWMLNRGEVANEILTSLRLLFPPQSTRTFVHEQMDKHLGESLWRMSCDLDSLQHLKTKGWEVFLELVQWCASRGGNVVHSGSRRGGLTEDDPSLQSFRVMNLMLHSKELKETVPMRILDCIFTLIDSGETGYCAKLMVAGLDLLNVMHSRLESPILQNDEDSDPDIWCNHWLKILKGISKTANESSFVNVRQHAISMLTDVLIDNHGRLLAQNKLYSILNDISIPLASQRIKGLLKTEEVESMWEEIMIELELCISLIFKPLLHHMRYLLRTQESFIHLWKSILSAVSLLLSDKDEDVEDASNARTMDNLLSTSKELAKEHLRNAVMVLSASGLITGKSEKNGTDVSSITWSAIESMEFCKPFVEEWKQSTMEDNENLKVNLQNERDKSHKESEASFDDLVIVSEGGEDTCESS